MKSLTNEKINKLNEKIRKFLLLPMSYLINGCWAVVFAVFWKQNVSTQHHMNWMLGLLVIEPLSFIYIKKHFMNLVMLLLGVVTTLIQKGVLSAARWGFLVTLNTLH